MLPFTKRNAHADDADSDHLGTGEIEVVEPRGARGRQAIRTSTRPVAMQPAMQPPMHAQHEPHPADDDEERTRIVEAQAPQHKSYPPITPAAGAPPTRQSVRPIASGRVSVRPSANVRAISQPSQNAHMNAQMSAMAQMDAMHASHASSNYGEDDECTIARPVSSPPPPAMNVRGSNRPPPVTIATPQRTLTMPSMLEEQERTAMMPVPQGIRARQIAIETPATIMAAGSAIPAELRQQVIAQMQAQRAAAHNAGGMSAMDQAIAAQLANVQRAQPISPPSHMIPVPSSTSPAMVLDNSPPTVVGQRAKVLFGRPTMSWAAAILAMGVFVGLVTAAVVRSDNQTEAAAQAARNQQNAAASQLASAPTMGSMQAGSMQNGQLAMNGTTNAMTANGQLGQVAQQNGYGQQGQLQQGQMQQPQGQQMMNGQNPMQAQNGAGLGMIGGGNGNAPQQTMPVTQITPEQLAAMTGGGAAANPTTTAPAVVTNDAPNGMNANNSANNTSAAAPVHHSHSTAHAVAARTPVDTTPAPAPAPRQTATAARPKKGGPSDDDVNSAAKALAKAQLEQSL